MNDYPRQNPAYRLAQSLYTYLIPINLMKASYVEEEVQFICNLYWYF